MFSNRKYSGRREEDSRKAWTTTFGIKREEVGVEQSDFVEKLKKKVW